MTPLRQLLNHPKIKGVCIGWCPDGDGFDGIHAHAHHHRTHGRHRGLICLAAHHDYNATTIRHELAHLIRGNPRHDEPYWAVVRELGGRKERQYT